jgi:hypothetical protein
MYGKTPLTLFDWAAYNKRMRRFKAQQLQQTEGAQNAQEGSSATMQTYKPTKMLDLQSYPKLAGLFTSDQDLEFASRVLEVMIPARSETVGWVYLYQREKDAK